MTAASSQKIENWWKLKLESDPHPVKGVTRLVARCIRVAGFTEPFARRVAKGYRQFLELKSVMNDWEDDKLTAPVPILQMWEQHLLDNLGYAEDCLLLFGRVIGHSPDADLDEAAHELRIKTTNIAFEARYGDDLDREVWDYGLADPATKPPRIAADHHQHYPPPPPSPNSTSSGIRMSTLGRLPVAMSDVRSKIGLSRNNPAPESIVDEERSHRSHKSLRSRVKQVIPAVSSVSNNDPITLFLRDKVTGDETFFSLKRKSSLRIVFKVFAEHKGLDESRLKFFYETKELAGYETPASLGLQDRARIDVVKENNDEDDESPLHEVRVLARHGG